MNRSHEHHEHNELVTYIANNDLGRAQAWLHAHLEEVRKGIEELTLEGETRTGKVEGDAGEE